MYTLNTKDLMTLDIEPILLSTINMLNHIKLHFSVIVMDPILYSKLEKELGPRAVYCGNGNLVIYHESEGDHVQIINHSTPIPNAVYFLVVNRGLINESWIDNSKIKI